MLDGNIQAYIFFEGMLKAIKSAIYYFLIIRNNYKSYRLIKA